MWEEREKEERERTRKNEQERNGLRRWFHSSPLIEELYGVIGSVMR